MYKGRKEKERSLLRPAPDFPLLGVAVLGLLGDHFKKKSLQAEHGSVLGPDVTGSLVINLQPSAWG